MPDLERACQMFTFGTGSSAVSREGENPTNALKNCAKTAAKINVRQASELDEFQHIRSGYLEFYTNRAQPPTSSTPSPRFLLFARSRRKYGTAAQTTSVGVLHTPAAMRSCTNSYNSLGSRRLPTFPSAWS